MARNKIAFIIQARMQSSRLPGKILLPLPLHKGKPLLERIIDDLQQVPLDKDIVVATTEHSKDDAVASLCTMKNIHCYRGSQDDVLSRFQAIAQADGYEHVLRYTADNPFVDAHIIKNTFDYHVEHGFDITTTTGLPLGVHVEIVKREALLNMPQSELTEKDREHVTLYLLNEGEYKKGVFDPGCNANLKDLRLTVDYPADFLLASSVFSLVYAKNLKGISLVEKVHKEHPWLFAANKNNIQKNPSNSLEDELQEARKVLKQLDLNRAADQLIL